MQRLEAYIINRQERLSLLRPACTGFTLIELSIVLVIVGLLVAGILIGQNAIKTAQIRSMVSQTRQYQTAVFSFMSKYNELPGDFDKATVYWPAAGAVNGNNNGSIDGTNESYNTWNHLMLAEMIPGNFPPVVSLSAPYNQFPYGALDQSTFDLTQMFLCTPYPAGSFTCIGDNFLLVSRIQPNGIVSYATSGSYWHMGVSTGNLGLTPLEAEAIDFKMDDGLPYTGIVRSASTIDSTAAYSCPATSGTNQYNVTTTPPYDACVLDVNLH